MSIAATQNERWLPRYSWPHENPERSSIVVNILYLCPHGAAKSVIANALTPDIADRTDSRVVSWNAGTDPDPDMHPMAVDALAAMGISVNGHPRLVTADDVRRADLVISMGCSIDDLPLVPDRFIDWSDVPDASVDVDALVAILEERITQMIAQLES